MHFKIAAHSHTQYEPRDHVISYGQRAVYLSSVCDDNVQLLKYFYFSFKKYQTN